MEKSVPAGMSATGRSFAKIIGAATSILPFGELDGRRNQTRAVPGLIGGICASEVVVIVSGAQSASAIRQRPSNIRIAGRYFCINSPV